MGTCTSTARHRQKEEQPSHYKRVASKNSLILDIKQSSSLPPPLPPLPLPVFPIHQRPYSIPNDTEPIFHPADTNSLIQLYSTPKKRQSFYSEKNNPMASSNSSIPAQSSAARIPMHKTRLPIYHAPPPPPSSSTGTTTILNIRPKSTPNGSINVTNHTGWNGKSFSSSSSFCSICFFIKMSVWCLGFLLLSSFSFFCSFFLFLIVLFFLFSLSTCTHVVPTGHTSCTCTYTSWSCSKSNTVVHLFHFLFDEGSFFSFVYLRKEASERQRVREREREGINASPSRHAATLKVL